MPILAQKFTVVAPDLPGLGQSVVSPAFRATDIAPLLHGLECAGPLNAAVVEFLERP